MDHNQEDLQKMYDKALFRILRSNGAFFGPIVGALNLKWYTDIPSAWGHTNGFDLNINPEKYVALSSEGRITLLYHEIRHVTDLHMLRRGGRDPKIWNLACDIKINLEAQALGYSFADFMSRKDTLDPRFKGMAEEHIYDQLIKDGHQPDLENEDILEGHGTPTLTNEQKASLIQRVVSAHIGAGVQNEAITKYIETLLRPSAPFRVLLREFFKALGTKKTDWKRRNRRYHNVFMPSKYPQKDKLENLVYFVDVSGSVTMKQIEQVHADLHHLWHTFKPKKMTVVQFHSEIASVEEFTKYSPYTKFTLASTGGTDMSLVYDYIVENKVTAAIVFSDNHCYPIADPGVPMIWLISVSNPTFVPSFGKIAYV